MMLERSRESDDFTAPDDASRRSNGPAWGKARFAALWERCPTGEPDRAEAVHARLVELYGEPHRHYHTLAHIQHCLDEFDRAAVLMDEPDAVEMALWFHDAIYIPRAVDNEWRSTELFRQWSDERADAVFQRRVHDLIMATTHRERPRRRDEEFMVDIDLSGFGLPWDLFVRDGHLIRAECADITDAQYYPGHLHFLRALQSRPTLFFTGFFQGRYEHMARENIRRIIAELHPRGYGRV